MLLNFFWCRSLFWWDLNHLLLLQVLHNEKVFFILLLHPFEGQCRVCCTFYYFLSISIAIGKAITSTWDSLLFSRFFLFIHFQIQIIFIAFWKTFTECLFINMVYEMRWKYIVLFKKLIIFFTINSNKFWKRKQINYLQFS